MSVSHRYTYLLIMIGATIIQGRKLIKGGNYSKEETIQGRKLFTEIRYNGFEKN